MHRVTQLDIPAATPIRSMAFYNQVFGWTFQPSSTRRKWMAKIESTEQQIFGNPFKRKSNASQFLSNAVEVKNLINTLKQIRNEGGQIIVPRFAVPGIGWMAYFKDLEQNTFGIMQPDKFAR